MFRSYSRPGWAIWIFLGCRSSKTRFTICHRQRPQEFNSKVLTKRQNARIFRMDLKATVVVLEFQWFYWCRTATQTLFETLCCCTLPLLGVSGCFFFRRMFSRRCQTQREYHCWAAFGLQWEKAWQVAALRNGLLFFPLTGLQIFKYETTAYIISYYIYISTYTIYTYVTHIYICIYGRTIHNISLYTHI